MKTITGLLKGGLASFRKKSAGPTDWNRCPVFPRLEPENNLNSYRVPDLPTRVMRNPLGCQVSSGNQWGQVRQREDQGDLVQEATFSVFHQTYTKL